MTDSQIKLRRSRKALRLIARFKCANYTTGTCRDKGSGRTKGAKYTADAWCDACIATEGLEKSK